MTPIARILLRLRLGVVRVSQRLGQRLGGDPNHGIARSVVARTQYLQGMFAVLLRSWKRRVGSGNLHGHDDSRRR